MSTTLTDSTTTARKRRVRWHRAGIGALAASAALTSTGCTLSDVSTILSILRLLGIIV